MTKADIKSDFGSDLNGKRRRARTVEAFMRAVRNNLERENVYLRVWKLCGEDTRGENRPQHLGQEVHPIPAHNIPSFKPSKDFVENVKLNVKVK